MRVLRDQLTSSKQIIQLHHSLQQYRCTILTGKRASGRTTCYRTLAAAYQRMGHLPVDIITINPAAYSWEQVRGSACGHVCTCIFHFPCLFLFLPPTCLLSFSFFISSSLLSLPVPLSLPPPSLPLLHPHSLHSCLAATMRYQTPSSGLMASSPEPSLASLLATTTTRLRPTLTGLAPTASAFPPTGSCWTGLSLHL